MEENPIENIRLQSEILRQQVPALSESLDDDGVDSARIERETFRNDVQKLYDSLKDRVGELEAMMRKLRQVRADQAVDCEKLNTRAFAIRRERKAYHVQA